LIKISKPFGKNCQKTAEGIFCDSHCSYRSTPPDDCQLITDVGRGQLRSSDVYTCVVPQTDTVNNSFSVA